MKKNQPSLFLFCLYLVVTELVLFQFNNTNDQTKQKWHLPVIPFACQQFCNLSHKVSNGIGNTNPVRPIDIDTN